jgi:GT2 family glycosyltransferase
MTLPSPTKDSEPRSETAIDLSVIVVSYNTRELLRDCLTSVGPGCEGLSAEVFVVDNASSDGSADMVRKEFPQVRLVVNDSNLGFAAANNLGLERAKGRYIVLLNSDTQIRQAAMTTLVKFMDARPTAGYCGPRLLNADGSLQASARRFPTVLSAAFSMLGLDRRYPHSRHALSLHSVSRSGNPFPADWLSGACLMVRSAAMAQVGLMDAGFFLYFEETDWCRRMACAGWEGWYVPQAEVLHLGGQSVPRGEAAGPFSGDHPVHWARSRRRYMRRYCGSVGSAFEELLLVVLYSVIWMRHRWRRGDQSRDKARCAATALRFLLT